MCLRLTYGPAHHYCSCEVQVHHVEYVLKKEKRKNMIQGHFFFTQNYKLETVQNKEQQNLFLENLC